MISDDEMFRVKLADGELFGPAGGDASTAVPCALAWRSRSMIGSRCARFRGADDFELLVTQSATDQLRVGTQQRAPNEAFGFLLGRQFRDERGAYTLVVGVAYADELSAGVAHVRLTPEESAAVRKRGEEAFPAADVVGWTHSHSHPSGYSPTDEREQATWSNPADVGLLTFMTGTPWARAYRGPGGLPLMLVDNAAQASDVLPLTATRPLSDLKAGNTPTGPHTPVAHLQPAIRTGSMSSAAQPPPTAVAPSSLQKPGVAHRRWPWRQLGASLLLLVLGAAAGYYSGSRGQSSSAPSLEDHTVAWQCSSRYALAPVTVTCAGPAGAGITGWYWTIDGAPQGSGPSIGFRFQTPGVHTIHLYLVGPGGSTSAGFRVVRVTSP